MKSTLFQLKNNAWERSDGQPTDKMTADLVLCFGAKSLLSKPQFLETLQGQFDCPEIAVASTSGEIINSKVQDNSAVAAAITFDKTTIKSAKINISDYANSFEAGKGLLHQLPTENLAYLLILSDGSIVNGSELVNGLNDELKGKVLITGGLAGDGSNFQSTLTGLNDIPSEGVIVAIGFYGDSLVVKDGSEGGWEIFGLDKTVTKSTSNKLYELNGQNCLDVYKRYLGEAADRLPAAALNFPLSVLIPGNNKTVVRTILGISENDNSMTFAGDMPEGSIVRFMKTNFSSLIDAAASSAKKTIPINKKAPDFALLVSCVGRKIVLGQRVNEEVEAVHNAYQGLTPMLGFYSYGEIAPLLNEKATALHNQTMTITSFYEI